MKKYIVVILACILIGISYNLFLVPNNLVPTGLIGLSALFKLTYGYNAAIFIALSNIILLIFSLPILGLKRTYKYLLTSFLIPVCIYLTKDINLIITIDNLETIILAVAGATLIGFGYSMIYKENLSIGGFEIIQDIFNKTEINQNKFLSYFIDFIVIILTIFVLNFEYAIYSTIITLIIVYLSTKAKFNISNNKSFFIITNKEAEVKDYLLNELKYDFTEFNVKGGFSSQKNKIIMTVIDTKDYYRLKEGISLIDDKAFISVIDNYESINKNIAIEKNQII